MVLEKYYQYTKSNQLKNVFNTINSYYEGEIQINDIENELNQISIKNNFDIIIKNQQGTAVYLSNKDFLSTIRPLSRKKDVLSCTQSFWTLILFELT